MFAAAASTSSRISFAACSGGINVFAVWLCSLQWWHQRLRASASQLAVVASTSSQAGFAACSGGIYVFARRPSHLAVATLTSSLTSFAFQRRHLHLHVLALRCRHRRLHVPALCLHWRHQRLGAPALQPTVAASTSSRTALAACGGGINVFARHIQACSGGIIVVAYWLGSFQGWHLHLRGVFLRFWVALEMTSRGQWLVFSHGVAD